MSAGCFMASLLPKSTAKRKVAPTMANSTTGISTVAGSASEADELIVQWLRAELINGQRRRAAGALVQIAREHRDRPDTLCEALMIAAGELVRIGDARKRGRQKVDPFRQNGAILSARTQFEEA